MTTAELTAALAPAIAQKIGPQRFQLWFAENTRFQWTGQEVVVGVPNRFYQEWLENTFTPVIREAAEQVLGRSVQVRFFIDPGLFQAARQQQAVAASTAAQPPAGETRPARATSRRWPRLEDFAVGPSNRLAHAAAVCLVEQAESAPSPVVWYGPSGVGKTHLLEAAYAASRKVLGDAVLHVTAEEFTNRFLQAMHAKQLPTFRKQFREALALFLDDVHFLVNKEATRLEFLHTLETLQRHGRPVVLTSACHPRQMTDVPQELVTRLLEGGVWAIEPLDVPTRAAVIASKSAILRSPLPPAVAEFLAANLRGNVREVIGALNALRHYTTVHPQPITLDVVRAAAGDLLQPADRAVQIRDVERVLCRILELDARALVDPGRTRLASHPRMVAMYLARQLTSASYSAIARHFGVRNHTTVMAAEKRIRGWLDRDASLLLADRRWSLRDLVKRVSKGLE